MSSEDTTEYITSDAPDRGCRVANVAWNYIVRECVDYTDDNTPFIEHGNCNGVRTIFSMAVKRCSAEMKKMSE